VALLATLIALPLAALAQTHTPGDSNEGAKDAQENQACGMMDKMAGGTTPCGMRCNAFDSLEQHFEGMMNINSMPQLKEEMAKHHQMMMAMHAQSATPPGRCTGMAGKTGGCGMMDDGNSEPNQRVPDAAHSSHH